MLDLSKLWLRIQPEILTVPFIFMSLPLSLLILLYISIPSIGALAALTLIPAAAWYTVAGIILVATKLYDIFRYREDNQISFLLKNTKHYKQGIKFYRQEIRLDEKFIKACDESIEHNQQLIKHCQESIECYQQLIKHCQESIECYQHEIKKYEKEIEDYQHNIKMGNQEIEDHQHNIKMGNQEIREYQQEIKSYHKSIEDLSQKIKTLLKKKIPAYTAITLSLLAIALYTFVVFPITLPIAMVACAVVQIIGLGRLTFKSHDGSETTAQKWYDRLLLILPFAVCSIATMIIILISPTWAHILAQLSITQAFPPLTIVLLVLSSVILVLCLLKAVDAKGIYDARSSTNKLSEKITSSKHLKPSQRNSSINNLDNSTSDTNTTHLTSPFLKTIKNI